MAENQTAETDSSKIQIPISMMGGEFDNYKSTESSAKKNKGGYNVKGIGYLSDHTSSYGGGSYYQS